MGYQGEKIGGGIRIGALGLNAEYAKEIIGSIQSLDINQFRFIESSNGKLVYFLWRHKEFVQCVILELKNNEIHNLHITMGGEVKFDGRKL